MRGKMANRIIHNNQLKSSAVKPDLNIKPRGKPLTEKLSVSETLMICDTLAEEIYKLKKLCEKTKSQMRLKTLKAELTSFEQLRYSILNANEIHLIRR